MIFAPAYGSSKKNATDIRLAIDALELVFVRPEIGTFILMSGDSDFSSLVIKLKEYGKYVIGDVMRADRLKQVMQQMDSTFDEKNVGKSKFSLFVAEAAKKGLLSLTKLENGQYEVDLPRSGVSGLPAGQSAPVAEPSENGEARRPRRDS